MHIGLGNLAEEKEYVYSTLEHILVHVGVLDERKQGNGERVKNVFTREHAAEVGLGRG